MRGGGAADPAPVCARRYVSLKVGKKKSVSTKSIKKTLNPQWNETFSFGGVLRELAASPLDLKVYDYDGKLANSMGMDDFLGSAQVYLGDLLNVRERGYAMPLEGKAAQGTLHVRAEWRERGAATAAYGAALPSNGIA